MFNIGATVYKHRGIVIAKFVDVGLIYQIEKLVKTQKT